MKTAHFNQQGIAHLAVVFVLVFLAVAGFAGYKVLQNGKTAGDSVQNSSQAVVPDKIESRADLVTTSKALDGSGSDVDNGLNDEQLNADLNDML